MRKPTALPSGRLDVAAHLAKRIDCAWRGALTMRNPPPLPSGHLDSAAHLAKRECTFGKTRKPKKARVMNRSLIQAKTRIFADMSFQSSGSKLCISSKRIISGLALLGVASPGICPDNIRITWLSQQPPNCSLSLLLALAARRYHQVCLVSNRCHTASAGSG